MAGQPSNTADQAAAGALADETAVRHVAAQTAALAPSFSVPVARGSAGDSEIKSQPALAAAVSTVAVVDDLLPPPADDAQAIDRGTPTPTSAPTESIVFQSHSPAIPRALRILVATGATPIQRALAATGVHPERAALSGARGTEDSHAPGTGPAPAEPKPAAPTDAPQRFPPLPGSPAGASSGAVGGAGAGSPTVVAALTAAVLVIALELWLAVAISGGTPAGVRRPLLLERPG